MNNRHLTDKENHAEHNLINKIGFWSALLSAFFYVIFDIVAIITMSGLLTSQFWISILTYTPSLFIALSFVILMVSVHYYAPSELKIWSHIGMALAGIYATLNCFIYIIQILVIAPSFLNGLFDNVALFEMAPNKPLYAANALAYSIMGLSTLFSAFIFKGRGLAKITKSVLIIHGAVAPTIIGVLIWKPLFFVSASVGITYPLAAILIAVLFHEGSSTKSKLSQT